MPHSRTLLIIDDEPDVCNLLRKMLRRRFSRIECAMDLAQAGILAKLMDPDVILLDNNLPDGYGLDNIGAFKQMLPGVHIVMLSALDIRPEALAAGADSFISKPFDTIQLSAL